MGCEVVKTPPDDHGQLSGLTDDDHSQYLLLAGRSSTQVMVKGLAETPVSLSDSGTVSLDASLGNIFSLAATQNSTISIPTNPTVGQKLIIIFRAISSNRTLSLTTGSTGAFSFGTDITALSETTGGLTDLVGFIYVGSPTFRWVVVSYIKGF